MKIYIQNGNVAAGPYNKKRLLAMIAKGKLTRATQVSIDAARWQPAGVALKAMFSQVAQGRVDQLAKDEAAAEAKAKAKADAKVAADVRNAKLLQA